MMVNFSTVKSSLYNLRDEVMNKFVDAHEKIKARPELQIVEGSVLISRDGIRTVLEEVTVITRE